MQSLQAYTEEAESLLYHSRKCIPKFINHGVSNGKQAPSVYQKLAEIRKEELRSTFSLADPLVEQNHIKLTDSKLIEKLVKREHLNSLIFNLYPANKGYTLAVIVRSSDNTEKTLTSMRLPYTEEQLFSYIDNEEIPPLLCSMIDNCVVQLYYNGCIIAEIRDYRKSAALTHYVEHHVLLHQSMQTIVNDVNEAINGDSEFEDKMGAKLELERTLLLANYGPLCLSPKPSIAIANQKLHYSKFFLNTHKLRFKARNHTLLGIARRKRQEQYTKCSPSISSLIDFIAKKKAAQAPKTKIPKKLLPECPVGDDFWTEAARTVLELAKPVERPLESKENIFNSKLIEEYIIETRDDARLQFMIKLLISQRNADYECIGEIQQSRELNTGGFHNISYSFPLGTHELATRYVLEFTNVYTERGKIRVNFTHKVPGKPPEVCVTSGLRIEGSKLVPIESKSLGLDTLVSLETMTFSKNDPKAKNLMSSVPKVRAPAPEQIVLTSQPTLPSNVVKQITISSDSLTPNQLQLIQDQNLQMQIQQQLQQQILQHKRLQQNQTLAQQRNAIENLKAQIQEHLQMRQTNVVNGVISQNVIPQYTSLLKKDTTLASSLNVPQNIAAQRTIATVMPKSVNANVQYQTANNEISHSEASQVLANSANLTSVNGNNSTILSLLANTSAQSSPSSSAASITLSNLLTSSAGARTINAGQTVNVSGQRVVAKRLKMQNAGRVISGNQQVATSLGNATVIATAATNVTSAGTTVNAQPVIRLSLSSLQNQTTPVIQQRGGKNITGRILTPGTLKNASLMNSMQPVTVTSSGSIQIGNSVHSISAVQSLLNSGTVTQTATGLRMKPNARRNVVVGGIQQLTVNALNGQSANDTQTINCAKIQTIGASQGNIMATGIVGGGSTQLSAGELQTLAGTLTAAPTIGTIQLTRNMHTLPSGSVQLVTNNSSPQSMNAVTKTTTLNSIQLNAVTADAILTKGQKIMRLSNNQEATSQASVGGLPMSTLSALLSGSAVADGGSISGAVKSNVNLLERLNSSVASTSQSISTTSNINLSSASTSNLGVQNLQVSIPGMAVPITLSLNNAQAVTTLSNIVGTSVILANSNAGNSIKTSALRTVANSGTVTNMQAVQQLQLIGPVQRGKLNAQISKSVAARSLLNTNRMRFTAPPPNAVVQQQPGGQGQVLSVTAQQQLQLALQKQTAQLQLHQELTAAGGLKVAQKRRRSSVATDGS